MPLPYPHRVSFLPPTLGLAGAASEHALLYAKLLGAIVADLLARHPVVAVFDPEDQSMADRAGRLVDAGHPDVEQTIDWFFRAGRRDEVLWLELGLDPDRPHPPARLRARRPRGPIAEYHGEGTTLADELDHVLARWLADRRLPAAPPLAPFTTGDLHVVVAQLARTLGAIAPRRPEPSEASPPSPTIPDELLAPPARLAAAYYRVLGDLGAVDPALIDAQLLAVEPDHPRARRNRARARAGADASRRDLLALVAEAPMLAGPHLAIRGAAFDDDRPDEGMGLRHQGLAAQLQPASPRACRGYALELRDAGRFEEAARWFERAAVAARAAPAVVLDQLRALRECQRPGATFAETTRRCGELLAAMREGAAPVDPALRRDAGVMVALAHLDVGRLDDAIAIASDALGATGDGEPDGGELAAERARVRAWTDDAELFARAYAWEGYHRGELGRVLDGFGRGGVRTAEDARLLIETLTALGRDDEAALAFHEALGAGKGVVGFGRTRLAGARALILTGELDEAIAHLQTAQLRRGQYRLEAEIDRTLRLAALHPAPAWAAVIERLRARGARTLAAMAARDLADFVPGLDGASVFAALGEPAPFAIDPAWPTALAADLGLDAEVTGRIDERLARPAEATLAAADELAAKWFMAVPPPARDAALHAGAAVYALGVALAEYLALASGPPTPLAGGYRQVATDALHLCHRGRAEVGERAVRGLLALLEQLPAADDLLDRWLLRVERALDLEATWGGYLPYLTADLPRVRRLLRGDERIAWELRLAHDLRADGSQLEPAERLFARCAVAADDWAVFRAWSDVAAAALPPADALDVHRSCARANPGTNAIAWVHAARALFAAGRGDEAVATLAQAYGNTAAAWRQTSIAGFEAAWRDAGVDVPFALDAARAAAGEARDAGDLARAERCLRWCLARDPGDAELARELAEVCARRGDAGAAIRAFATAGHTGDDDRRSAAWQAGVALLQHGHPVEAAAALRLAALRFRTADEWRYLAWAAWYAGDHETAAAATRAMLAAGAPTDPPALNLLMASLLRSGQWTDAEHAAQRLGALAGADPGWGALAAGGRARALCGQGRYGEALPWAERAATMNPVPEHAAELDDTVACARERRTPAHRVGARGGPGARTLARLVAGDVAGCARLARGGTTWDLRIAELLAAVVRAPGEDDRLLSPRALETASAILDQSAGVTERDAVRARLLARRVVDDAFIQIDPPPPLGARVAADDLDRRWRERGGG